MKRGVLRRYRKAQSKRAEPNCIHCSPALRNYRYKYTVSERRRMREQALGDERP